METAAELLATGSTMQAAADTIQGARSTVSTWFNHHIGFQQRYNERRRELWSEACERLRSLVPPALDTLAAALTDESVKLSDKAKIACAILRATGVYDLPVPGDDDCDIESLKIARAKTVRSQELDSSFYNTNKYAAPFDDNGDL